jgi:penicillin-binding protein 1A
MVGGVDWSQSQFNNAAKAQVQPGSTAKLPLVLAACEAGKQPKSRVVDLPISPGWPSNGTIGYRGETSLEEAIAWSRNAAAVRLTRELGPKAVAQVSRSLGVDPGPEPDAAFVLGTFSTNPLTMAAAYATVANGGYGVAPQGVLAAVDGRGEIRVNNLERDRTRVISSRCVDHAKHILREVVQSGTGRGAALPTSKTYGKTGTTSDNVDAWFIGWTEGRVLAIWMGRRRGSEGSGSIAGSGPPAVLFRRIQQSAIEVDAQRRPKKAGPAVAGEGSATQNRATARHPATQDAPARTSQVPLPPMRPRDESSGNT